MESNPANKSSSGPPPLRRLAPGGGRSSAGGGPPPRRSSPPPRNNSTAALSRSQIAELGVQEFALQALTQRGIDPNRFVWIVPVESIHLRTGTTLADGWVCRLQGGDFVVFRYSGSEGFQLSQSRAVKATADMQGDRVVLGLDLGDESDIESCSLDLEQASTRSRGAWFPYWCDAVRQALGLRGTSVISIASAETLDIKHNGFGIDSKQPTTPVYIGIDEDGIAWVPDLLNTGATDISAWYVDGASLEVTISSGAVPRTVRLAVLQASSDESLWQGVSSYLPAGCRRDTTITSEYRNAGVFERAQDGELVLLRRSVQSGRAWDEATGTVFQYRFELGTDLVCIASEDGECLALRLPTRPEYRSPLDDLAQPSEAVRYSDSDGVWIAALAQDPEECVVRVGLSADGLVIADRPPIALDELGPIHASETTDGLLALTVACRGGEQNQTFITVPSIGYAFWAEIDARTTDVRVASAATADLYKQFNEAKKHNLLLVMFGDLLLLNRALDADIPMEDLVTQMQDVGAVKFAENDTLRDATVGKILLLTSSLTAVKQKFELLAAMAPYYWAQEEAEWLTSVFGSGTVRKAVTLERKRIVPLVRRQIRVAQSDMQRSLTQIEAAARPLDVIFAKDEIQKHWSSKVRQFVPAAVQGTIGGVMLLTSGGALGWHLVGGAVATHGLGGILAHFQKDREAAAQIRRAAETIFPWWQVFMKSLVVSIFEASDFMDEENVVAMKRDRRLLDSTGDKREVYVSRLRDQLRRRIVAERRNSFAEVIEGSGVRLAQVVGDIEKAIGPDMRESVDGFVQNLVVAGRRRRPEEANQ